MIRTIKNAVEEIKKQDKNTAITEYFVRKLVKENKIAYVKSGKKYLISIESLLAYINEIATVEDEKEKI